MIALREKHTDLDQVCKQHRDAVMPYVQKIIAFYQDIFAYLPKVVDKNPNKENFLAKMKEIRTVNDCPHYKKLLKALVVKSVKFSKEEHQLQLIYRSSYISAAKDQAIVSAALIGLQKVVEAIICLDQSTDPAGSAALYKKWRFDFAPVNFLLETIFDYENWFLDLPASGVWGPYQMTMKLNIRSCPYCNRQYTFSLVDTTGKKLGRPELDHFLPKRRHPLLALSFYNLVPSCKGCNGSSLKGANDTSYETHLSPYELNARNAAMRFTYMPLTYEASVGQSEELDIRVAYGGDPADPALKKKVSGNLALFALAEIYRNHTDIVQEIIHKRHVSNDRYIKTLQSTFKDFPVSVEDAYRLAFGNYYKESDFGRRPLAKLTKDIALELTTLPKSKK